MGQWLRLYALSAGGLGSIPSQGARSHMPQLRTGAAKKMRRIPRLNDLSKRRKHQE